MNTRDEAESPDCNPDGCFDLGHRRPDAGGVSSSAEEGAASPGGEGASSSIDEEASSPMYDSDGASYPLEAFRILESLWRQKKLCDVEIEIAGEGSLKAHRLMLAAASPYFRAMFTCNLKESQMTRIPIHGVSLATLERIVEFAYTGRIRVDEKNVCQLLPAANMLQVQRITNACCRFLERQLDPSNCIGIADFALQHGMAGLHTKASHFIEQHFSMVSQLDEFLSLPSNRLVALLRKDALNVRCESEVFEAVMRWARQDESSRGPQLEPVLQAVRCHFLAPHFLQEQVRNCALVKNHPKCCDYLSKVIQDLTLHKRYSCCLERLPNVPSILYVAGGYLRRSLSTIECFSAVSQRWSVLPNLPLERSGPGGVFLQGLLYVVGGRVLRPPRDFGEDVSTVHCFDPATKQWSEKCSMGVPRHRLGVAVLDGRLYAVAGSHGTNCLSSVERYDPAKDEWTNVASLSKPRYGLGTAVVRRWLYAIGGCNSTEKFGIVERYHPETDKWEAVSSLHIPRSGAGTVALGKYIYVIGGYDGRGQVSSVERYDTDTDTWHPVAPLKYRRSALSAAVLGGKIYALGGYDGQEYLSTVEVYDPDKDEWTAGPSMPSCKSGHASCTSPAPCLLHRVT